MPGKRWPPGKTQNAQVPHAVGLQSGEAYDFSGLFQFQLLFGSLQLMCNLGWGRDWIAQPQAKLWDSMPPGLETFVATNGAGGGWWQVVG